MPPRIQPPKSAKNGKGFNPQKAKKGTFKRLLNMLVSQNKKLLIIIVTCIVITAITGVASSFFLKNLLEIINRGLDYVNKGFT